jgi:hypothetical protein
MLREQARLRARRDAANARQAKQPHRLKPLFKSNALQLLHAVKLQVNLPLRRGDAEKTQEAIKHEKNAFYAPFAASLRTLITLVQ